MPPTSAGGQVVGGLTEHLPFIPVFNLGYISPAQVYREADEGEHLLDYCRYFKAGEKEMVGVG